MSQLAPPHLRSLCCSVKLGPQQPPPQVPHSVHREQSGEVWPACRAVACAGQSELGLGRPLAPTPGCPDYLFWGACFVFLALGAKSITWCQAELHGLQFLFTRWGEKQLSLVRGHRPGWQVGSLQRLLLAP